MYEIVLRPSEVESIANILGASERPVSVVRSIEDDPFATGWNAAMKYMRDHLMTVPFLPVKVIFNNPATIVYWNDGTKTVVKCQPGDVFSAETGLTTAMLKKYMGNDNTFNRVINEWLKRTGEYKPPIPALPAPTQSCDECVVAQDWPSDKQYDDARSDPMATPV